MININRTKLLSWNRRTTPSGKYRGINWMFIGTVEDEGILILHYIISFPSTGKAIKARLPKIIMKGQEFDCQYEMEKFIDECIPVTEKYPKGR